MALTQSPTMTSNTLAAAEHWRYDAAAARLELDSAFYGEHGPLRDAGESINGRPGNREGAFESILTDGVPRIVTDFGEMGFLHQEAAGLCGLGAAAMLPQTEGESVVGVTVLYFRADVKAAVELWSGTRGRFELSLAEAYHPGLERFSRISRHVNFPRGAGLPGMCWETGLARIVPDVSTAKGFLRSSGAGSDGLGVGLGVPLMHRTELRAVLLLISGARRPVAAVHEVWVQDPADEGRLIRSQGVYGGHVTLAEASRGQTFTAAGESGLIGGAWATGRPVLLDGAEAMAEAGMARLDGVHEAGLRWAVALPVVAVGRVRCVVTMLGA